MMKGLHQIWLGGSFKCASSFTDHFCIRIYSLSLADEGLCFLFKLPWLFDCGHWVQYNFKFVFSFYRGIWSWFLIFSFSFDLEVDLCLLLVDCVSFFLAGFVVSFSFGFSLIFIFLWSLFWRFMVSVLMWVVVSSESSVVVSTGSMPIGLNLLDNRIGSFISVFCLVWIFPFLCLCVRYSSGTVKMCSLIVSFVIIFSISIRFFNSLISLFSSSCFGFVSSFSSFPFFVTYA